MPPNRATGKGSGENRGFRPFQQVGSAGSPRLRPGSRPGWSQCRSVIVPAFEAESAPRGTCKRVIWPST
jgi:hypothetical protein